MEWLLLIFVIPYVYLLLRLFLKLNKILPYTASADPDEFISVVIPCHNEEKYLPRLLKCIEDQDQRCDLFEVIIVDDNSTDSTYALASGFKSIKNIRVVKNKGNGKKLAIMEGVSASRGSFIITTDADCMPGRKWISTIAAFVQENKPDIVICPVMLESKPGFPNRFQELEFLSLQGVTAGAYTGGRPVMCNGANLVFRRDIYLLNAKSLHPEIQSGDDIFLLHGIKKYPGAKISWLESGEAIMITSRSETLKEYINQRSRWISKAGAYEDRDTIILGLVTFCAVAIQLFTLIAGIFSTVFLAVFGVIFLLKSLPDFLILRNTTRRYGKPYLMNWFLPCQMIYPFYVVTVIVISVLKRVSR